ncbi:MAG TPA: endonuclease/exonuclease/phosphatase family protein [Candidatus Acidoferrales bacterium]|jgi:exodeoxyribonuclease-3
MKLVTWNCAMALHKKHEKLLQFGADIMVIQECSRKFIKQIDRTEGWSSAWFGKNPNKGLGVIVKAPWIIQEARALKPKWIAKLIIDGPVPLELFPVWACTSNRRAESYIGQVHLLLDILERANPNHSTIIAGDFNSNSIWDGGRRINNHSAAVGRLRKLGMVSAYHAFFKQIQGAEKHPTFWFTKNKKKVYHLDYAFLSERLSAKLKRVEVGHHRDWLSFSDHAPILVELDM